MNSTAVSLRAYAKINLHLEVLGKRKDGFHNINSIFCPISLYDEILLYRNGNIASCLVEALNYNLPKANTITRAYDEFSAFTKINHGVNVNIIKNIPSGAGLGGGSSDAASILQGLNKLFETRLTESQLMSIASKIGSDVPFFIGKSSAHITGRGEDVSPIDFFCNCIGVLVYPEINSLTSKAYALLNRNNKTIEASFNPIDFCNKDCSTWPFFNSFEDVLFKEYPILKEIKLALLNEGADFALMSGAGSSVFGLFKNKEKAEDAYMKFSLQYKRCFLFFVLAL